MDVSINNDILAGREKVWERSKAAEKRGSLARVPLFFPSRRRRGKDAAAFKQVQKAAFCHLFKICRDGHALAALLLHILLLLFTACY